jgi:hypothetical protein
VANTAIKAQYEEIADEVEAILRAKGFTGRFVMIYHEGKDMEDSRTGILANVPYTQARNILGDLLKQIDEEVGSVGEPGGTVQ